MKRFFSLLALLALGVAAAFPVDFGALQPQGFVSDFAGVIDAESRQRLDEYARRLEAATGAELAIVTLPTLQNEPIEDVAETIFRKWGIGKKGASPNDPNRDQGILLLLITQDRRSRLEVGYGLEPIIPDGLAGSVLRDMRPALRAEDYGQALLLGARTIGSTIAQAKNVNLEDPAMPRRPPRATNIPWPVIIGGIFLLLWLSRMGGRGGGYYGGGGGGGFLPGLILGNVLGRGLGGGRGSGGFGGYDSGDSFGGFGGGSSGGGGASSDW